MNKIALTTGVVLIGAASTADAMDFRMARHDFLESKQNLG